ncbi:hypothetical protein HaLaN_04166, partial [Haematococcus lacustris]
PAQCCSAAARRRLGRRRGGAAGVLRGFCAPRQCDATAQAGAPRGAGSQTVSRCVVGTHERRRGA